MPLDFGSVAMAPSAQMCFLNDNSKSCKAINVQLGRLGQMHFDFGVSIVNFRVIECKMVKITRQKEETSIDFTPSVLLLEQQLLTPVNISKMGIC